MTYLARQARILHYPAGSKIPTAEQGGGKDTLYLLSGILEFRLNGAFIHRIDAKDAKATFPIAFSGDSGADVLVIKESRVLHFPKELVAGAEKVSADGKHYGSEPADTDLNPGVFIELLEKAEKDKLELPSPPDLGVRISKAIDNPDTSIDEVVRIIQLDPALTARLIQVSNSPLYMGLDKIQNANMAVTRLGLDTTRNLVISFLLKNLFQNKSKTLQRAMNQVWAQSSRVAAISSILAKVTPRLDSGRALLAGLVHQIGAIGVINAAQNHPELMEDAEALNEAVTQLGPQIGAIILERWNFGADLVDVVINSADWMRDEESKPSYTDLVMVARLHAAIGTPMMRQLPRMDLVPAFHKLALGKLTPTHSSVILDEAEKSINEVQALLH
jgi:HD-like signal output (HDOD) protein